MNKERLEEIKEPFADLEKVKIHILKEKIMDGLDEFKTNKGQQWTELRFEKPLLDKLLSSIEQAERTQEFDCIDCNGKGFNGLVPCTHCVRGEIFRNNLKLKQQNKRYRESLDSMRLHAHHPEIIKQIYDELERESK